MATFSSTHSAWKITGEPRQKESFIDIDSGGAELGQSCANEDCKKGTCFQADDKAEEKCMYVLMQNERGCSSKMHTTCTQGLKCVDDVCVFPNQKPASLLTPPQHDNSQEANEKFDRLVLYSFMISILALIVVMLILLAIGA